MKTDYAETARRKRVLLIAFHFPPFAKSSGWLRTFCFARDLLALGWQAIVLTVSARVHENGGDNLYGKVPAEILVERAAALDVARDLAVASRYPDWLALPDRWWSWLVGASILALRRWRSWRPDIIWSTYPIATAHLIGLLLARSTGVPWVADFRDPMVEQDARTGRWIPGNRRLRSVRLWIERSCVRNARYLVFCTEGARQICLQRYGGQYTEKCVVIPNGFDEEIFYEIESKLDSRDRPGTHARTTLVHSGVIYATPDRDPTAFLQAVSMLKRQGLENAATLRIVLRASGNDELFRSLTVRLDCQDIVELPPALPYEEAIAEMFLADGLLIFQGYPSNPAIPAKLYEYLRAGRPILAVAHADGETARLVLSAGAGRVVDLEDADAIASTLAEFLRDLRSGNLVGIAPNAIAQHARAARARELATLLDSIRR